MQKSVGKNCLKLLAGPLALGGLLVGLITGALGCALGGEKADPKSTKGVFAESPAAKVREELEGEISLKADRAHLEEIRKSIPEEKKQANDELALIVHLLNDTKIPPSEVQSRYQRISLKHRERFRKKTQKLRDGFNREERARREAFLKEQNLERTKFTKARPDREKSKEFFAEHDLRRKEFFSSESDRRKEFESELRLQSKDFDSHMREKSREFNEQLQLYSRRYHQKQREDREAAKRGALRGSGAGVAPAASGPSEVDARTLAPQDEN